MPTLSTHSNVFNTCFLLLKQLGWRYWVTGKGHESELFWAERDGWDLTAASPIELLGLVMIFEHKKPASYSEYWWRVEGPDLLKAIPTKAPRYHSRTRKPN